MRRKQLYGYETDFNLTGSSVYSGGDISGDPGGDCGRGSASDSWL